MTLSFWASCLHLQVQGLQSWGITLHSCCVGSRTQGFMDANQELYLLSYLLSPSQMILDREMGQGACYFHSTHWPGIGVLPRTLHHLRRLKKINSLPWYFNEETLAVFLKEKSEADCVQMKTTVHNLLILEQSVSTADQRNMSVLWAGCQLLGRQQFADEIQRLMPIWLHKLGNVIGPTVLRRPRQL